MSKVMKHETDENKYQSGLDDYGHGSGNGKSRQAIYKHLKKVGLMAKTIRESKGLKTDQKEDTAREEFQAISPEPTDEGETVVDWSDFPIPDENEEGHTIPTPIKMMAKALGPDASGKSVLRAQHEAQGQVVRWSFMTADRMFTWWARGVMNDDKWSLDRSKADYDVLQETTTGVMNLYGITIPINPWAVWGITVSSAYIPSIRYVRKNADPSRKKRSWRLFGWLRKKKPQMPSVNEEGEPYA